MEKECLRYSAYERSKTVESKYIPGKMIVVDDGMVCPRCDLKQSEISHSEIRMCTGCSLQMQVFGNALYIWEE